MKTQLRELKIPTTVQEQLCKILCLGGGAYLHFAK